jgi:hypothetical protein
MEEEHIMNLKGLFNKKTDTMAISVPIEKVLYGVKIRKLPNGAYIKALQTVQNLPAILMENCFPGQDIEDILKRFGSIDKDGILALTGQLMAALPEQFLKLISTLLDISLEKLTDELSPKETIEILEAFWEANDLSPFFEKLKGILKGWTKNIPVPKS